MLLSYHRFKATYMAMPALELVNSGHIPSPLHCKDKILNTLLLDSKIEEFKL